MKKNFIDLIRDYIICIPAIQREYVQGYKEEKTNIIRENFINDIFDVLCYSDERDKTEKELDIGIIYGYKTKDGDKKNMFFPVDGQQRLTTLYIIYWCLNIMKSGESNVDLKDKALLYEVRNSTTRFFNELVSETRREYFKGRFSEKQSFLESLISQEWFEDEWLNDVTVLAAINVISEVSQKIKEYKDDFCDKALEKFSNIKFGLSIFEAENARINSSLEFAKINARGKQLELFENVKSYLNIIEEKIGIQEGFVYNYDTKYIDLFYDLCKNDKDPDRDLEKITKLINDKTIILLINAYKLLKVIEGEDDEALKLQSELDYLSFVIEESKKDEMEGNAFWKKYISFLNNILYTIFKMDCLEEMDCFSKKIIDFNRYRDNDMLLSKLLYYNHYKKNQRKYMSKEIKSKYVYVLSNLKYLSWREYNLKEIDAFIAKISEYTDIFDCFASLKGEEDLNILNTKLLDDIQVRIKEQSIKCKIIKEHSDLSYDYFKEWEDRFHKRSIFFLLYFSGYWATDKNGKWVDGDYDRLRQYLEVAKKYFFSDSIKVRRIFALAVYYNIEAGQMMTCNEINERASYRFIRPNSNPTIFLESNNMHQWRDEYYFMDDNLDENNILLRERKLYYLRLAYDLYHENKINGLYKSISGSDYDSCWLKYAIDRNYVELFDQEIRYNTKPYILNHVTRESLNFFAYVYILDLIYKKSDKNEELWKYDNNGQDLILYDQRDIPEFLS